MNEKLPGNYRLHERDPYGNTLIRSEWPLQIWKTEVGNYSVWLWTHAFDGFHCIRKDLDVANAMFDAARDLLR